jgi:hypothetical protein
MRAESVTLQPVRHVAQGGEVGSLGKYTVRPEGRGLDPSSASCACLVQLALGAMWIAGAVIWARAAPGSADLHRGKVLFGIGFGINSFVYCCCGGVAATE